MIVLKGVYVKECNLYNKIIDPVFFSDLDIVTLLLKRRE
jgi:hypothetical protein